MRQHERGASAVDYLHAAAGNHLADHMDRPAGLLQGRQLGRRQGEGQPVIVTAGQGKLRPGAPVKVDNSVIPTNNPAPKPAES